MKKFLITLMIALPVLCAAQTNRYWGVVLNVTDDLDTVICRDKSFLAGYTWSVTYETVNLTSPIIVDIGGSNRKINKVGGGFIYAFEGFAHDSLPYTFDPDKLAIITNDTTTVQKTFRSGVEKLNFDMPCTRITTGDDTEFILKMYWTFAY